MDIKEIIKSNLGIDTTPEICNEFIIYAIRNSWTNYKKELMDKETVIKNEINALPIRFVNGTVLKEYQQTIEVNSDNIEDVWIEGLEQIGLTPEYNENNKKEFFVHGIPENAGDFKVTLKYKYKGWCDGKTILSRDFSITINPDPHSLWKNIPTPTDIEFYKDDSDCEYLMVERLDGEYRKNMYAASQRGRSHAHEGKARDDDFKLFHCDNSDWYIMTVADGAGSSQYSRKGSEIACKTALEHCKEKLIDNKDFEEYIKIFKENETPDNRKYVGDNIYDIVGNAAFKAHKAIVTFATKKGLKAKDFATTLLLAICKKFDFGWFVASFWVGDGAMCIYDKDRHYIKMLGTPDEGEFSGQTRFLTMPEIFTDSKSFYGRLKFSIEKDFTALLLMTDGVSDPMFETDVNLNSIEKWDELWDNIKSEVEMDDDKPESKYQLLRWLDFWSQGNHDDRTIAILH